MARPSQAVALLKSGAIGGSSQAGSRPSGTGPQPGMFRIIGRTTWLEAGFTLLARSRETASMRLVRKPAAAASSRIVAIVRVSQGR